MNLKLSPDLDPGNAADVGKDLDTEQKRLTLSTYVGAVAQLHKDALMLNPSGLHKR